MYQNCRNCNADLIEVVDFGKMPISNAFISQNQFSDEYFYNMTAMVCQKCYLFQLLEQPNPNILFHDNYAFFAGSSNSMQKHFDELSDELIDKFELKKNDLVVEIGCNDGGVINYLKKKNHSAHLGVDPSKNVYEKSKEKGINMMNKFFNIKTSNEIVKEKSKAKIFISLNTLAHIANINSVFEGIESLLNEDGIFISEDPYLFDVLEKVSYDQIYDEHVFVFSVTSMNNLCNKHGLNLYDLKYLDTHGGSMRYYVSKNKNLPKTNNFNYFFNKEKNIHSNGMEVYKNFNSNCIKSKTNLINFLNEQSDRKIIASYGATSKSTTIFNYCNINTNQIKYITDTTSTKINKFSPGTHIPIYDYDYFTNNKPDICFLGAWNHSKEIFKKEKNNFSLNGKWITHTPEAMFINDF
jgi:methylation protein EvaC